MKRFKSQFGEGIGGPVSAVEDPNDPSFDPATHQTATDKKIRYLCEEHTLSRLTEWERTFVMSVYGESRLSRKQHITVSKIHKKHTESESAAQGT